MYLYTYMYIHIYICICICTCACGIHDICNPTPICFYVPSKQVKVKSVAYLQR